jgi:hypothetical protein
LKKVKPTDAFDETSFWTVVALYVLEEFFAGKESEWKLISEKARSYLKSKNIT